MSNRWIEWPDPYPFKAPESAVQPPSIPLWDDAPNPPAKTRTDTLSCSCDPTGGHTCEPPF